MRNALQEKVQDKLKNKGKQRMRPKMGKMEIDYNLMQDAFFKKQQKPPMTKMGDLYYEGAAACT
jgi:splicing factor 3B subunit 2